MRVALVSPYDMGRFGGVQNQVTLMRRSLERRGHDAWIVGPGRGEGVRSLGRSITVPANDSTAPIKLSPILVPRLRKAVADADVVHVHEPLMPLVSLAARWTGKPLIGTFHADPSPWIRRLYRSFAPLRWHMASFRAVAAVSETAHSAVASFGDVAIIPNGIETVGLPEEPKVPGRVAFVGRDDRRKGLDVAIAAMSRVRESHPEAELLVITPSDVDSSDGVRILQGIGDEAKLGWLATSDVYVAPNRRGESFGLTVAEGMAAGCACVVSDIEAFAAVTGDAALRVRPDAVADWAATITSLLDDRQRLTSYQRAAAARAADFSIERTVDRYESIYREMGR